MDAVRYTPDQPFPAWLDESLNPVRMALKGDRASHAWLVSAQPGNGMRWLFARWSYLALCDTGEGCGQCRNCQLLNSDSHPDMRWLQPEDRPTISVDQVRELSRYVWETPQIASRKLVFIRPAESMTLAAANALLKTLEEPPGFVMLVLGTYAPGTVLPTLKSRCHQISLKSPGDDETRTWLGQLKPGHYDESKVQEGLALGLAPFEFLGDWQGLLQDLHTLSEEWRGWLSGRGSLTELAARWAGQDQDALTLQMLRVLHAHALSEEDAVRLQVISDAASGLMNMRKLLHEKRNLNPALAWEHWLLEVRRNMKEKGARA
ncbi:MAG: hypothetical protein D6758_06905 [Gammaproteobacteria bacterium]|nr:MAG: hypothetical protein D6758_06905 [Gammaproteobacteria bacterium]